MMLEAMKVNESCKASSSMQRMEHIAEHGNEIQSELRTIKEEKQRGEETARGALSLQRAMMDSLCVGVVTMVCTVVAVVWFAGSHPQSLPGLSVGPLGLRTTRTMALSSCQGSALVSSVYVPRALSHRVLPVFMPLAQLCCYAVHAVRLIQACILLVLTPIMLSKLGLFKLGSEAPVFKLLTTCGLICGASGWFAVDWLGGRGGVWLVLWESFVALAIGVIVSASRIVAASVNSRSGKPHEGWLFVGTIIWGFFAGLAPFLAWGTSVQT